MIFIFKTNFRKMTNLLKTIYSQNNEELDFQLFCLQIPFFQNIAKYGRNFSDYYLNLSEETKNLFRKIFYLQYSEFDCDIETFIELVDFLDFIDFSFILNKENKLWIPYFRRYLYSYRKNTDLMIKTVFLHFQDDFLINQTTEPELCICPLVKTKKHFNTLKELYNIVEQSTKSEDVNIYGVLKCIGNGTEKDIKNGLRILEKNWIENQNENSLYNFCFFSENLDEIEKFNLLEPICITHKQSLIFVVDYLYKKCFYGGFYKGNLEKYFSLLWTDFRCSKRLYNHGMYLRTFFNDYNSEKACEIFEISAKETGHPDSIFMKALYLAEKNNLEKARLLYLENWTKNKHRQSLESYTYMLKTGKGGAKDIEGAEKLEKDNNIYIF